MPESVPLRDESTVAPVERRTYDIFLSHNSADKPLVERIAERLKRARLEPWLDVWSLVPGADWQPGLAEGLAASRSCAVFVGPADGGAWKNQEVAVALDRAAADPEFRIFLVLLPGLPERFDAADLSPFLRMRTWVDYRGGLDDERAFQALVAAIQGVPLGPAVPIEPESGRSPYRGLEAFEEEHAEFFFGREADVQRLLEKLKATRFLAVLGASGSGKSSLVRAGLVPALKGGELPGATEWEIPIMRPGPHPLEALAAQVVGLGGGAMQQTLDGLAADPRSLHLAGTLALTKRPAGTRLLLVVDQFEEVFTLCRDEAERGTFLANLLYAATVPDGPTGVLVAMRADFYHRSAAYPELAQQLAAAQYLVSPMTRDGLRLAVEEPARRVGLSFEPGLVATILDDVAERPGALPLLEHALFEVWQRRTGGTLTLAAYRESGGVEGALAKRAEAVFDALGPDEQQAVRRLFLRLTQPGEGTEDTRRRARLSELDTGTGEGEIAPVLSRLTDARLVTTSREEAAGGELIEVTHEALIRGWPRLRAWIDEDRAGLRVQRRLTDAAGEWERLGRDPSALLRGARLAEALAWREADSRSLSQLEQAFLDASRAAEQDELEQARRRTRRLRVLVAVLALLLAAAVGAGWWALRQTDAANASRDEAMSQAQLATARALAATSVVRRSPVEAMLLSLEGYRLALDAPAAQRFEARNGMLTVLEQNDRLLGIAERPATEVAFSPDGALVATAGDDGTVQLWDAEQRVPAGEPLEADPDWVSAVAFSPDGRTLASAGADGAVRLWDVERRVLVGKPLAGHGDSVLAVAFSPDGSTLASAGRDRTVRLWDVARGAPVGPALRGHTAEVRSVAFNPDGTTLASGGLDATVRLWDVEERAPAGTIDADSESVDEVAFSPDGTTLASAGYDGAQLWDVERLAPRGAPLEEGGGWIGTVAFSPDGERLASAGQDGTIRLWDVERRELLDTRLEGHSDSVWSVKFSPDGRRLASAGDDGTVRLWDADARGPLGTTLEGHTGEVWGIAFSPDGRMLASSGDDAAVRLWDVARQAGLGEPLLGHAGKVWSVAFSTDGRVLASGGADGTVRLWDVDRRAPLGPPLEGHDGEVRAVAFSPDRTTLASGGADGTVRLWDVERRAPLGAPLEADGDGVWSVAFAVDGRRLAAAGADGAIRLWDVERRALVGPPLEGHTDEVRSVAFSPAGTRLASAGQDGTVRLWDVARRRPLGKPLEGHAGWVLSVAFAPDGRTLASGGADHTVRLWDAERRVPLGRPLEGHDEGWVDGVAFSPAGGNLASAGGDWTVRLWDPILTSADLSPWQRRLCAIAGRNLTPAEWRESLPEQPYRTICPRLD